jgi:hypothetical protein
MPPARPVDKWNGEPIEMGGKSSIMAFPGRSNVAASGSREILGLLPAEGARIMPAVTGLPFHRKRFVGMLLCHITHIGKVAVWGGLVE